MRFTICCLLMLLVASNLSAQANNAVTKKVPRADCFPFERLTPAERVKAEALLLKALDSEALYTIIGNLKPMSSGFGEMRFSIKKNDLPQLAERRRILAAWRCGDDLTAYMHYFQRIYNGERSFDAVVMNRSLITRMIEAHQPFWSFYGITPNAELLEILLTVEHDTTTRRNIGYGYLFGYPDYAVDFFAEAADRETRTNVFVERDFLVMPTFDPQRRFVWATPKGYREQAVDQNVRAQTQIILDAYRTRRANYIGVGKPGVVALLRDWFCDERGGCSRDKVSFATVK